MQEARSQQIAPAVAPYPAPEKVDSRGAPTSSRGLLRRVDLESPLSAGLQQAAWPEDFKFPSIIEPYNGDTDPREFVRVYETAIEAAGWR